MFARLWGRARGFGLVSCGLVELRVKGFVVARAALGRSDVGLQGLSVGRLWFQALGRFGVCLRSLGFGCVWLPTRLWGVWVYV